MNTEKAIKLFEDVKNEIMETELDILKRNQDTFIEKLIKERLETLKKINYKRCYIVYDNAIICKMWTGTEDVKTIIETIIEIFTLNKLKY